jgi:hypothetical protein
MAESQLSEAREEWDIGPENAEDVWRQESLAELEAIRELVPLRWKSFLNLRLHLLQGKVHMIQ